ncbi:hypothetical protein B0T17DRAFT_512467 [Bombardia bombarda]|uniref:Uncharacterized protein n=1 Tax=Bombardia bombarda TaxID=252184 RepID=A0AA39WAG0_9PEZI|nr:hypothetical protein B0T17DRAFT_512467 [Bombardia bombarda]
MDVNNARERTYPDIPRPVRYKLEQVLRNAGLYVLDSTITTQAAAKAEMTRSGHINKLVPHVSWEYQGYSIAPDRSLKWQDPATQRWIDRRYDWLGVEVSTPAMFETRALFDTEIDKLCQALRSNMRLQLNRTCALHVTVSHQQPGGLHLKTLKKALSLVWLVEPLLFQMCAPYRQGVKYCRPVTECSELAVLGVEAFCGGGGGGDDDIGGDDDDGDTGDEIAMADTAITSSERTPSPLVAHIPIGSLTPDQLVRLSRLWRAHNPNDVAYLMRAPNRYSDRLAVAAVRKESDHEEEEEEEIWMLEFRAHEGMLDPTLTKMWAGVCVALLKKASAPVYEYRELMVRILDTGWSMGGGGC